MKKFVLIVKQNILKFKIELVLFFIALTLIAPIAYLSVEKKEKEELASKLSGKTLEITVESASVIFSNDVFVKYNLSKDLGDICGADDYDCFMTIWVYDAAINEYRRIGPIENFEENKDNETFIPNDLVQSYNLGISNLKIKVMMDVFLGSESKTLESSEFEM